MNRSRNLPAKLQAALSDYFGVTPRTVARWASLTRPFTPEGLLTYLGSLTTRSSLLAARIASPSLPDDLCEMFEVEELDIIPDPNDSLTALRARKIQLETERIQLVLDRERGELVSRRAMYEAGVKIGAALAASLASLCDDLPGLMAGKSEVEIRKAIVPRVAKMQTDLNEEISKMPE